MEYSNRETAALSSMQPEMSPPPSPSKPSQRPTPMSLRVDTLGVNPSNLVGKVLRRIVRSLKHPMITLHFTDSTAFQIHIEGYHPNPVYRGLPKDLEMDASFESLLSTCEASESSELNLTVSDCAFIRLTDKAFEKSLRFSKWDQNHLALALKFHDSPRWHCVWATVVEHDNDQGGIEVFRSYEDVYLQPVSPSRVSPSKWRTGPSPRKG